MIDRTSIDNQIVLHSATIVEHQCIDTRLLFIGETPGTWQIAPGWVLDDGYLPHIVCHDAL
jgi:hypothetical protein